MKTSPNAFLLRYGWSAWPSSGTLPTLPPPPFLQELGEAWNQDGIHLLEHRWQADTVQLLFSGAPDVAPVDLARVAKGRLQHALRKAGHPTDFSRKVAVRALGENTRETVETYVSGQLEHADLADPRYRDALKRHAVLNPDVKLDEPFSTNSGQYWYNLHVVLVTNSRWRMGENEARMLAQGCRAAAAEGGYGLAKMAVMPDHAHLAVRGHPEHSPNRIAQAFQATTAKAIGMMGFWKETFYVGTFGEYGMGAVRR